MGRIILVQTVKKTPIGEHNGAICKGCSMPIQGMYEDSAIEVSTVSESASFIDVYHVSCYMAQKKS